MHLAGIIGCMLFSPTDDGTTQPGKTLPMTGFWIQGDVIGPNTLIPRDPDCDTFTRPVYMVRKTVDYDHRPSVIDTTYSDSLYGDDDIIATIASAPDLARMINSVVIIDLDITRSDGTVKRSSGTGCLVSPVCCLYCCQHL